MFGPMVVPGEVVGEVPGQVIDAPRHISAEGVRHEDGSRLPRDIQDGAIQSLDSVDFVTDPRRAGRVSLVAAPEMAQMMRDPAMESALAHVRADREALPAIRHTLGKTGKVPESWKDRDDAIGAPEMYNRGSHIADTIRMDISGRFTPAQHSNAITIGKLRNRNLVSAKTAADAFPVRGANPFAIDQLGMEVMKGFRLKSFSLMVLQCICVLGLGILVDESIPADAHPGNDFYAAFLVFSIAFLFLTSYHRHKYPINYILEAFFTLFIGVSLGLSTQPLLSAQESGWPGSSTGEKPAIYAFGFYTVGLTLIALMSLISTPKGHLVKCFPCSLIAVLLVITLFLVTHELTKFCPVSWLLLMIIIVSICLVWVGIECDRLASKLCLDEFLLPVILVWADLFVLVGVCFLICLLIACGSMGDGGPGGYCWGCHGLCYPWTGADQRRQQQNAVEGEHTIEDAPEAPV